MLHLHTNMVVLSIYDDGTPADIRALVKFVLFMLDSLRLRRLRGHRSPLRLSPIRQAGYTCRMKVVNTKALVLLWSGFDDPLIPGAADWFLHRNVRRWTRHRGGNIPQCFIFSGNQFPYCRARLWAGARDDDMKRLAITSSTRFRPKRQWHTALEKELVSSQEFVERFLSDGG
jgi:hypothetical protein